VPGLKVEEVFKRVRIAVTERSKGAQTPWESSSLTGDLVVNVTVNVTTTAALPAPAPAPDRESLFWTSIKDGNDPAAFQAYLRQYPEGTFAALARQRLASLSLAHRTTRFDGTWNVTIQCPPHASAAGYNMRFQAEVKDGTLDGQYRVAGAPNSVTLKGRIQPDGTAIIDAHGTVGDPRNAVNRPARGSTYSYRVDARFDETRGSGERRETRPCTLTFVR
jgi:hypothetical protein